MTRKRILICVSFLTFLASGCYYDKEQLLYPNSGACNAAGSTYSSTVAPILTASCNSCHSTAAAPGSGGNIILDTYAGVKIYADNGKLLGSINHASGFSPMPKGGGSLSSCDISKITNWVNSGALNN
jgi:hypothetical protein